ncbi:hypothetical protein UB43_03415 [Pseudomonas sp. 21]|uniref:hypothetical protein n=1 Tax=Pseudomonas sp. 21 TaxID=1619948 RepID=UPI0005EAED72|nr:hypothetical protein [Pseudomonas sp. 21]KJK03561.1 hypothetical protein UB43_03415 [Pseudomonas sp. 21]
MSDANRFLLDEVARIGHTWHGLAFGGEFAPKVWSPYGIWDLPFYAPADYDTHLLKVPGIPDLDMTLEEWEAEAAVGRVWQNYALLSGSTLQLFGKPLNGWVVIDEAGGRWLVRTSPSVVNGRINKNSPLTLTLSIVPFGYLGTDAWAPVTISTTLTDLGQASTGETVMPGDPEVVMRVGSISSNGRKVVIELHSWVNTGNTNISPQNFMPSGFLMLELSGAGPSFTASLGVLRTRSTVCGYTIKPSISGTWAQWAVEFVKVSEEPDPLHPGYAYVTFRAGDMVKTADNMPINTRYSLFQCSGTATAERQNRLIALLFDEADALVEFSCTHRYTLSEDHGPPSITTSGTLTCLRMDTGEFLGAGTGDMVVTPKAEGTGYRAVSMSIYRAGVEVLSAELKIAHQFTRTYSQALDGIGGTWFDQGRYPCFDLEQGEEEVQQSWTMNVGATSLAGSYPGHDYRYGIGEDSPVWPNLASLLGNSLRPVSISLVWGEDSYLRNANWTIARPSNQLTAMSWGEDSSGVALFRTAKIIATGADVVPSDIPSTDNFAVNASYHPVTKEIARPRSEITAPFCWI